MKKTLLIILFSGLTGMWGYDFIQFCLGNTLDEFTIGCSLLLTVITCLNWTIDQIRE